MITFYLACFSSKSIITAKQIIGLWTSVVFVYNLMVVMRWIFIGWALVNVSLTSFLSDALHGCKTATVGLSCAGTLSLCERWSLAIRLAKSLYLLCWIYLKHLVCYIKACHQTLVLEPENFKFLWNPAISSDFCAHVAVLTPT